ncbi:XylR family transcriptional regulator [Pinibacter aurantiacus]|uniref:XylR family transcriptional regulator n=1 Tax=Pinibacter aurantiacus TaxID=2851599 RepID=A0A9E2SDZ2_9BACT|nr:XylR family transcriptional regulator [Pinibacter aurantiacus]MBV4359692.1 XylR family transcriptional regulator [Pinibacter aurantiacus]
MKNKQKVAVLLDVARAYDRDILAGITTFNKIHDKFIFFFFSPKYVHSGSQANAINRVIDWKPDGILTREIDEFELLLDLDIPLIIFPHTNLYKDKINSWGNNKGVGKTAADYFIAKGYKHYAFLGFKDFQWSIERQEGYIEEVGNAGYTVSTFIFDNTQLLWERLPARLTEWVETLQRPCAIFAVTDELNMHLLNAINQTESRVPDDFSILGVDNDEMLCDMASPTLSSIDQNAKETGFEAASALSRWIEHGEKPVGDIVSEPGTVITRGSTSALAIDDEQVRAALHYITNAAPSKDISVDDVVNVTTLSRRILEKRFQSLIKSSVLEEIKKVRIQRIKFLLENSELTIQQIADELNFRNFDNITRYFKQYAGMNPKDYRNKFK